jgi:hypothetical protein
MSASSSAAPPAVDRRSASVDGPSFTRVQWEGRPRRGGRKRKYIISEEARRIHAASDLPGEWWGHKVYGESVDHVDRRKRFCAAEESCVAHFDSLPAPAPPAPAAVCGAAVGDSAALRAAEALVDRPPTFGPEANPSPFPRRPATLAPEAIRSPFLCRRAARRSPSPRRPATLAPEAIRSPFPCRRAAHRSKGLRGLGGRGGAR